MITSILAASDSSANGLAHVLSKIDYKKLRKDLKHAIANPDERHTIVLFEYVHSGIYDTIAEIERIPGTVKPIHEFLQMPVVENALKSLFVSQSNMSIYTRRKRVYKTKVDYDLTKVRQLVLAVDAELPSLIPLASDPWGTSYSDVID